MDNLIFGFLKNDILAAVEKWKNFSRDEDWWVQINSKIDLNFWINDNPESPNYNKREVWAYRVVKDMNGFDTTDTSEGILVTVL